MDIFNTALKPVFGNKFAKTTVNNLLSSINYAKTEGTDAKFSLIYFT